MGFSGDGGPATSATLSFPHALALDGGGSLLVVDANNHRVRRVAASTGIITTVVGTGVAGFSGDGGPARSATLYRPTGLALDGGGNMLIADTDNHRIRLVNLSTGIITTLAGTGMGGFNGDGGPATSAWLYRPHGLALDGSGNLLVADRHNHRIRQIAVSTGIITTIIGTGTVTVDGDGGPATSAALNLPQGVAFDGSGNLLVAEHSGHRIRRLAVDSGIISTLAGTGAAGFGGDGGPATSARLSTPTGLAVDSGGNVLIADHDNSRIRFVSAATQRTPLPTPHPTPTDSSAPTPTVTAPSTAPCALGACASTPASSCAELFNARGYRVLNGTFWLQPAAAPRPYEALCEGAGWELALRTDGRTPTFGYDSPLWTDASLLNANVSARATDAKLAGFLYQPGNELLVRLTAPGGGQRGSDLRLSLPSFASPLALFSGGYVSTSVSRANWSSLVPGGATFEADCNAQGVNLQLRAGQHGLAFRIGVATNNENECSSCDAALGVGAFIDIEGFPQDRTAGYNNEWYTTGPWVLPSVIDQAPSAFSQIGTLFRGTAALLAEVYVRGPVPTSSTSPAASAAPSRAPLKCTAARFPVYSTPGVVAQPTNSSSAPSATLPPTCTYAPADAGVDWSSPGAQLSPGTVCTASCAHVSGGGAASVLSWGPRVFACLADPAGRTATWVPLPHNTSWSATNLSAPGASVAPDAGVGTLSCVGVSLTLINTAAQQGARLSPSSAAPAAAAPPAPAPAAAPGATVDTCGDYHRLRWPAVALSRETARALDAVGATRESPWYRTRVGSPFYAEASAQVALVAQVREAPVESVTVELSVTPPPRAAGGCAVPFTLAPVATLPGSATELVFDRAALLANLTAAGVVPASSGGAVAHRGCAGGTTAPSLTLSALVRPRLWGHVNGDVLPELTAPVVLGELVADGAALALVTNAPSSRCSLLRSRLVAANGAPGGVPQLRGVPVLSDALPPLVLVPELPVPPAPGETLALTCEITGDRLAVLHPSQLLLSANGTEAVFSAAERELAAAAAARPSWARATNLTVWPLFQGSRAPAETTVPLRIECTATSRVAGGGGGLPAYADVAFSQPLVYLFAAWPFIGDATIHKVVNRTTQQRVDLPVLSRSTASRSGGGGGGGVGEGGIGDGGGGDGGGSGVTGAVFEVVTNEAVNVTLTRDRTGWLHSGVDNPVFTWCTQVFVGDVPCAVVDVAADGTWLTFTTPPYGTFAAGAAQQLEIVTPLLPGFALLLACAPFCPTGARMPALQLPLVTSFLPAARQLRALPPRGGCSSRFGTQPPLTALAAPLQLFAADAPPPVMAHALSASDASLDSSPADLPGGGVVYYDSCAGTGSLSSTAVDEWRDPMLPECRDRAVSAVNRSLAKRCAFGGNGSCTECPAGAMCPGGYRAFAVPGSYTIEPSNPLQLECDAPAAQRCLGWDAASGQMQCGAGYTGFACASCARGFFPDDDNVCTRCPPIVGSGPLVLSLLFMFLACALVAVAIVLLTLVAIHVFGGGSVKDAGRRARELILFFWTSVQLMVQLSTVVKTSQVPPQLQALFQVLSRLNFQDLAPHPACTGWGGVLTQHRQLFGAVTGLTALLLAASLRCRVLAPSAAQLGLTALEQAEVDAVLARAAGAITTAPDDWAGEATPAAGGAPSRRPSRLQAVRDLLTRLRRVFTRGTARVSERSKRNLLLQQRLASARRVVVRALPWHLRVGLRVDSARTTLQRVLLTLLVLLYPPTVKTVIESVACKSQKMKVSTYRGYQQDGSTLRREGIPVSVPPVRLTGFSSSKDILRRDPNASTLINVRVMDSNRSQYIVCQEGLHTSTASWAAGVAAYYLVGFPLLALLLGAHFNRRQAAVGGPDLSLRSGGGGGGRGVVAGGGGGGKGRRGNAGEGGGGGEGGSGEGGGRDEVGGGRRGSGGGGGWVSGGRHGGGANSGGAGSVGGGRRGGGGNTAAAAAEPPPTGTHGTHMLGDSETTAFRNPLQRAHLAQASARFKQGAGGGGDAAASSASSATEGDVGRRGGKEARGAAAAAAQGGAAATFHGATATHVAAATLDAAASPRRRRCVSRHRRCTFSRRRLLQLQPAAGSSSAVRFRAGGGSIPRRRERVARGCRGGRAARVCCWARWRVQGAPGCSQRRGCRAAGVGHERRQALCTCPRPSCERR